MFEQRGTHQRTKSVEEPAFLADNLKVELQNA
jgi:hypothetical protein